jgi:hypothetical protein
VTTHAPHLLAWLLAIAVSAGCSGGAKVRPLAAGRVTPARLYPLALGSAWSYDVDSGDGEPVLAITRVVEATASYAGVLGGEGVRRYELRPDGLFQAQLGGYLLREPIAQGATWNAGRGRTAHVTATGERLQTAVGELSECVTVREDGAASGAVVTTRYCPEVGPVEVTSELTLDHGTVVVRARLRGYRIGPESSPN